MKLHLVLPRLPLPFGSADGRWFHVLASRLPVLGVDLHVVAIHEGTDGEAAQGAAHAHEHGYSLRVVQPSISMAWRDRAGRVIRPRTEFAQSAAVGDALRAIRADGSSAVTSNIFDPGIIAALDALVEIHYLTTADQRCIPVRSPAQAVHRLQTLRAERRLLGEARAVLVNSQRMAGLVAPHCSETLVTPLTLDPDLYRHERRGGELTVGFVGSMFWEPTRCAAERLLTRVWPVIRAQVPRARLLIAGWMAREHLGRRLPIDGVELVGSVGHPSEFFERISVLVFPAVAGTGVKIKTLEAMAYGVPVVTNAVGVEGLEGIPGAPEPTIDDDTALARAAVALLTNRQQRSDMAAAGRTSFDGPLHPMTCAARFLDAVGAAD